MAQKSKLTLFQVFHQFVFWNQKLTFVTVCNAHFICFSLDNLSVDERIYKDVQDLVFTRIRESVLIQKNITPPVATSKASNHVNSEEVKAAQTNFAHYIIQASRGNFLYVDLVLNFVKEGKLQVKSSSFKSIPTTLSEVFQLAFNLKYPTHEAFLKVKDLICIMVASLRPLSQGQLYDCINALKMDGLSQGQLEEKIKALGWIIKVKSNGQISFFHPTVRDWLVGRRSTSDSSGFVCDPREGHAAIGNKTKIHTIRIVKFLSENSVLTTTPTFSLVFHSKFF